MRACGTDAPELRILPAAPAAAETLAQPGAEQTAFDGDFLIVAAGAVLLVSRRCLNQGSLLLLL